MELKPTPAILEALRMRDGIIVTFETGEVAIYSPALLYSIIDQSETVEGLEDL